MINIPNPIPPSCPNGQYPLIPHRNAVNPCLIQQFILYNAFILLIPGTYQLARLIISIRREKTQIRVKDLTKANLFRICCVFILGLIFASRWDLVYFRLNALAVVVIGGPLAFIEGFISPVSSGSLLFYTLFQSIALLFSVVQSTLAEYVIAEGSPVIDYAFVGALLTLYLSSCEYEPTFKVTKDYLDSGITQANILSQITFSWMNELIDKGYRNHQVTEEDIPTPPANLDPESNYLRLKEEWDKQLKGRQSLLWALIKAFGGTVVTAVGFELLDDILSFVQPLILRYLILFFTNDDASDQPLQGYILSSLLFVNSVLATSLYNKFFILIYEASLGTKSALMTLIYQKSLKLSPESRKRHTTGDVMNLLSVDTSRVQDLASQFQMLVSAPFKLILCIGSLYSLLGEATFAGLGVMAIMIPINTIVSRKLKLSFKTQMKFKDARTRLTTEILTNIKSIKLYGLEKPMFEKLSHVRNDQELKNLGKIGIFSAMMNFMWSCVPFLVTCTTFLTFALMNKDKPLTPEIVFPALALFDLLSEPIYAIPSIITSLIETNVAFQRIGKLLQAEEINEGLISHEQRVDEFGDVALSVKDCVFTWEALKTEFKDDEAPSEELQTKPAMTIPSFEAKKGQLTCVIGKVGSGKSTFLKSLLGFLPVHSSSANKQPKITHYGSIAYCSQIPWITNASFKENILFGHKFDPDFYDLTIKACQLIPDLEILPDGDETQVGEKGITLSGGQKARLSLARAVYSRADVLLLDDILSAVDSHVSERIVKEVILDLVRSKCVILATNSIGVLSHAGEIILLEDGEIAERGTLEGVKAKDVSKLKDIIDEFANEGDHRETGEPNPKIPYDDLDEETEDNNDEEDLERELNEEELHESTSSGNTNSSYLESQALLTKRESSIKSHRRASIATFQQRHQHQLEKAKPKGKTSQEQEKAAIGRVNFKVYKRYAQACGVYSVVAFISLMIMATSFNLTSNYVLKAWSESNSETGNNNSVMTYIGLYSFFGLGGSLFTLGRTIFMWVYCSIKASRVLHQDMAHAVLRSPMSFFETTPVGRILNRFTSDLNKIDEAVPRVFAGFFGSIIRTTLTLVFIAYNMPLFLIVIVVVSSLYVFYQRYYVATSRDLKRIVSISRSPIFQHVQESLNGVETVLSYSQSSRFHHVHSLNLGFNIKALYLFRSINRWLSIRLQFLGSLIIFSAAALSINENLSPAMAGLIITYALRITASLNWIVRMTVEVETNVVSIERVLDFTELKPEAPEHTDLQIPSGNERWPNEGQIAISNYSARYRANLPLVLQDVNLDIKPREKIGIVGRTGSGKSTLTMALFRIIEPDSGKIIIDGINTAELGLTDLRSNLAIIPQDSQAFEGTVRENLDPVGKFTDEQLWWGLELAGLKPFIENLGNSESKNTDTEEANSPAEVGLYAKLSEGGSNLSVGQRQLLSLSRALLNPSRVLVLDEATASVDFQTDKIIQQTIRREFKDRTILTIAHRLETVMDCDRIAVLERGKVVQFDTVENLLRDQEGAFYGLCSKAGVVSGYSK